MLIYILFECFFSYYDIQLSNIPFRKKSFELIKGSKNMKKKIFLDSGAFSAWTKGVEIDIDEYIAFIKEHKKLIAHYSVLDEIGNPKKTLANQKYMEKKGLSPIPCFHYNEDEKYLQLYVEEYDYISLGGMVPISTNKLEPWLNKVWARYLIDKRGFPKVKVHGFGMTIIKLMRIYPWYSVDSVSWLFQGRTGSIYVPRWDDEDYDYSKSPHTVLVSEKGSKKKEHFSQYSLPWQKRILSYLKEKGFSMEELATDYKKRDLLNIMFFQDFVKTLPKWPWTFKREGTSEGPFL